MKTKVNIAILISGRGSNMESIGKSVQSGILQNLCSIKVVLCNKEAVPGIEKAKVLGLSVRVIPSAGLIRQVYEEALVATLQSLDIDFIVLAGFNRILSPFFVNQFPGRIINIHPADTLVYKGAEGYRWAYENKQMATKITVHWVDEGVDTGAIIAQEPVDLRGVESLEEVVERGLSVEQCLYPRALASVFEKFIANQKKETPCAEL
jgi:phosphoribosylglycinamide formyltransferase-1